MSNSGVGRGRGWLNLKPQNVSTTTRVGCMKSPTAVITNFTPKEDSQFVDIPKQELDLVTKVRQLNVNDDGILFNQKIKYILEDWKINSQTSEEVETSFDILYQACLNDAELASKVVVMIASRSFITQEVHDQNIRLMFLRKLQNSFDNSKNLRKTNETAFRNSVHLLGEFYNKARLADGQQLTFLATPLMSYLEMLLEDAQIQDLQLFTSQLYLNGSALKSKLPDKFSDLLNGVRHLLISDKSLTKESKLWLLLSLEVAGNRFGILPNEVNKFYEDQLGDSAMASFQVTHSTLSVQTSQDNTKLDNYQSNVNVLQVSTTPESTNEQIPTAIFSASELNTTSQSATSSSGFASDTSSQSSNTNRKESSNNSSKHGRPILGAGARLAKHKSTDESKNSNWRDRDNSSGWNNKPKGGGWGDSKKTRNRARDGSMTTVLKPTTVKAMNKTLFINLF